MTTKFRVEGMTCNGCARAVENAVKIALPSASIQVDLAGKQVAVENADEAVLADRVKAAIEGAGFTYGGPA